MAQTLSAALAAPPPNASFPSHPSPPSPLPAFRLRTAAMRALRRCERAAFLSEGVTFSTVAAAASGGVRSLPRYPWPVFNRSSGCFPPPAFASRGELLEYEEALREAAALDDALNFSLGASTPAERAEADAAVEAAMVPCVDFVTRRRRVQRKNGNIAGGSGSGGGAAAEGAKKKETAPPPPTTSTTTQQPCSQQPPPSFSSSPSPSPPTFLTRFSALGVRLTCATVSASWLEGKRRRAEADEIYWGCLGVTSGLLSSSSSSSSHSASAGLQKHVTKRSFRRRGHWWTRLALNAEAAGRPSQALEIVEAALADDAEHSVCFGDRLGLMRRGFRLARPPRRWRAPPPSWAAAAGREPRERVLVASTLDSSISTSTNAKSVFEGNLSVENLALLHYSKPENGGWQGAHAEGGVWGCLFRALFHDVMFPSPLGNSNGNDNNSAFSPASLSMLRVPCQRYPLDFGSPLFYELRQRSIDALLDEISSSSPQEVAAMVSAAWDRGLGAYAAGGTEARWNRSGPGSGEGRSGGGGGGGSSGSSRGGGREELRELCGCLGGRALAAVLELFAKGVAREGGMPDLVLWRRKRSGGSGSGGNDDDDDGDGSEKKKSSSSSEAIFGEAMVVEVKGPRDRLSVRCWSFFFF